MIQTKKNNSNKEEIEVFDWLGKQRKGDKEETKVVEVQ